MMVSKETAEHYRWGEGCDGWHLVRSPELSVIEERMPAGTSEVLNYHVRARQFFYVLSGELTIELDGQAWVLVGRRGDGDHSGAAASGDESQRSGRADLGGESADEPWRSSDSVEASRTSSRRVPMRTMMRNGFRFALLLGAVCGLGWSQTREMVVGDKPVRISEHVWGVMGFPNIGIVVGDRATLVVDTGLGRPNGEKVARMAAKLAAPGSTKLFLTATHFHPEHAGGVQGFPANTIVVWDAMEQREMEKHGQEMIDMFRQRSAKNAELLAGTVIPVPDVTFDREAALNLGGVRVKLLWFGEAHTKGDELIFVEGDDTLISGDVVQDKTMPMIFGDGGTPSSWLAVLDKVATLPVYC